MQDNNDNNAKNGSKNVKSNIQDINSGRARRTAQGQARQPQRQGQTRQPQGQRMQQRPQGQARPQQRQQQSQGQARPQGQARQPQGQTRQPQGQQSQGQQTRQQQPYGQPRPQNRQPQGQHPQGQQYRPQGQQRPLQHPPVNGTKPMKPPKKKTKKKKRKIILFVVEILLILLIVGGFWLASWVNDKVDQISYVELNEDEVEVNQEVQEAIDNGTSALQGYRNIALFGVDSRTGELEQSTRTDTIMIMSINLDTKEVKLVSVMRDTWLNLGTDSYGKANAAYAKGSYKQAINMLNMNLDLNITDFVTVGFDGLIDAIDAIGGIEIDVKESEIEHLNNYQICMVGYEDGTLNAAGEPNYKADPGTYTPVTKSGLQTLNGLQATAYARIRYVGNDTARTSRQRTVLTQAAKKAMTMNVSSLNKIVDTVLPQVYTSLSKTEILSLIAGIAGYSIGENSGFPFDDYVVLNGRINGASVVVPVDLTKNVSLLHEFLFGEENYEPTETVKRCSQKIASDSGYSYNGD